MRANLWVQNLDHVGKKSMNVVEVQFLTIYFINYQRKSITMKLSEINNGRELQEYGMFMRLGTVTLLSFCVLSAIADFDLPKDLT